MSSSQGHTTAAPRLTSHLRALSLIAPIQKLEDTKGLLRTQGQAAARATILAAGSITLGDILARAAKEDGDDTGFQRCLFLILEQAIDPRTADIAGEASILGVRFDA